MQGAEAKIIVALLNEELENQSVVPFGRVFRVLRGCVQSPCSEACAILFHSTGNKSTGELFLTRDIRLSGTGSTVQKCAEFPYSSAGCHDQTSLQ